MTRETAYSLHSTAILSLEISHLVVGPMAQYRPSEALSCPNREADWPRSQLHDRTPLAPGPSNTPLRRRGQNLLTSSARISISRCLHGTPAGLCVLSRNTCQAELRLPGVDWARGFSRGNRQVPHLRRQHMSLVPSRSAGCRAERTGSRRDFLVHG